jgi:hypothetical protein
MDVTVPPAKHCIETMFIVLFLSHVGIGARERFNVLWVVEEVRKFEYRSCGWLRR